MDQDGWRQSDTELFARYGDAWVPRRREQIDTVCELLADVPGGHVLDVCCGEGLLSEEYLRRHEQARVTVLDGSTEMLARAAERLEPYRPRWRQVRADIADRGWREGVSYGGVMTSLAVHHLDAAGKQELYRDLHAMLEPCGVFVMADLVEPAAQATRELAADHWERAVREVSVEAAAEFARAGWNYYRLPGPDPVDRPSPVVDHLRWLADAGFAESTWCGCTPATRSSPHAGLDGGARRSGWCAPRGADPPAGRRRRPAWLRRAGQPAAAVRRPGGRRRHLDRPRQRTHRVALTTRAAEPCGGPVAAIWSSFAVRAFAVLSRGQSRDHPEHRGDHEVGQASPPPAVRS